VRASKYTYELKITMKKFGDANCDRHYTWPTKNYKENLKTEVTSHSGPCFAHLKRIDKNSSLGNKRITISMRLVARLFDNNF